jgi:photosystem II stability/assembly factor-like uncharacterized protein
MRIAFPDPQNGFIFGGYGYLAKTTDQGANWTVIPSAPTNHFMCAWVFSTSVMVAGTSWGKILKSVNGGADWAEKHSEPGEVFGDVGFADSQTGIAVSGHGKIYRTTDAGETWSVTQIGMREYTHVCFISATTGWISGSNGYMLRTTDAGLTWTEHFVATHQAQNNVFFLDADNGFLTGNGGMLLRTSSGGLSAEEVPAPAKPAMALGISPNPFSGRATISYTLPCFSEVELVLYDLTGNRCRVIASGAREPGIHREIFNAAGLSGGIYICKLNACGQQLTAKLILTP